MITDKSLKVLRFQLGILFRVGAVPFTWDPIKQKYVWKESRIKFCVLFWLAIVTHLYLSGKHLLSCLKQQQLCSSLDQSVTIYNFVTQAIIALVVSVFAFTHPRNFAEAHNGLDTFLKHLTQDKNFLPRKFEKSRYFKLMDKFLLGVVIGMNLVGVFVAGQCWIFPGLKIFVHSSFSFISSNFVLKTMFQLGFSLMILTSFLVFAFLLSICLPIMGMSIILIKTEFRLGLDKQVYLTRGNVRFVPNLVKLYRAGEILLKLILNCYAIILLPGEMLLSLGVVNCSCCLIIHGGQYDWIQLFTFWNGWVSCLFSLIMVFEIGGRFEMHSKKTIQSWLKPRSGLGQERAGTMLSRKPYFRRFARSCRPLCFCYKEYRKIRRATVLILLRTLTRNTFRVLATVRGR